MWCGGECGGDGGRGAVATLGEAGGAEVDEGEVES